MTEPTEAQIKEARNLLPRTTTTENVLAVARLIAQRDTERAEHEAFRQQVSDLVKRAKSTGHWMHGCMLDSLIIPDPTPEQVLAEAIKDGDFATLDGIEREKAAELIEALAKRGHHVAPIKGEG